MPSTTSGTSVCNLSGMRSMRYTSSSPHTSDAYPRDGVPGAAPRRGAVDRAVRRRGLHRRPRAHMPRLPGPARKSLRFATTARARASAPWSRLRWRGVEVLQDYVLAHREAPPLQDRALLAWRRARSSSRVWRPCPYPSGLIIRRLLHYNVGGFEHQRDDGMSGRTR